jgi:hypothetical protein
MAAAVTLRSRRLFSLRSLLRRRPEPWWPKGHRPRDSLRWHPGRARRSREGTFSRKRGEQVPRRRINRAPLPFGRLRVPHLYMVLLFGSAGCTGFGARPPRHHPFAAADGIGAVHPRHHLLCSARRPGGAVCLFCESIISSYFCCKEPIVELVNEMGFSYKLPFL